MPSPCTGMPRAHTSRLSRGEKGERCMDAASAALLGMGLAAAGFAGAGVGIGYIFGKMIEAGGRPPEAGGRGGQDMWVGVALVEAVGLYGDVGALIILGPRQLKDARLLPQLGTQV